MSDGPVRLSASKVLSYDNCARSYFYQYIERLGPVVSSANMAFGTAVHGACTGWLEAQACGRPFDPVAAFEAAWTAATTQQALDYSSKLTPEELRQVGILLAGRFPDAWDATDLVPVIAADGRPLIEVRLEADLGSGVILSGVPDVVALDGDGNVTVLDLKTAAAATAGAIVAVSDQLAAYQLLLAAHAERLGIDPPARLGFLEMIKRKPNGKTGPTIEPPVWSAARSAEDLAEFHQKALWVAEDIARGRFPKRPRMAFNTPCGLCDFAGLCQRGDREGLMQRRTQAAAQAA